jgi:hypothetical protein
MGKGSELVVSLSRVTVTSPLVTVSIRNGVLKRPGIAVRSWVRADFLLEGGLDQDVFRAVCGVMRAVRKSNMRPAHRVGS